MRKITTLLFLMVFIIEGMFSVAVPTRAADTSFDIAAYRVGSDGEWPTIHIVDALNNSLLNMESDEVRSIDDLLDNYLGKSLSLDDNSNVLLSFRIEGTTLGTYYVAVAVSDFYNSDSSAFIKGQYSLDNLNIVFNDSYSSVQDGANHTIVSNTGSDEDIKNTVSPSTEKLSTAQSGTNAVQTSSDYASAWWTIADNPNDSVNATKSSDYWICRGAIRLQINEDDPDSEDNNNYGYNNAPIGVYKTNVIIEWGTIS